MSSQPVPQVAAWVAGQPADTRFTASVCQAESSRACDLPEGRRRLDLEAAARAMFLEVFEGRVLPFRHGCRHRLRRYLRRPQAGRAPTATIDLMIASVVRSQNATVVTRDISGFEGCGLTLINPWDAT